MKAEAAKPRGRSPRGFAAEGLPEENPEGALTLPRSTVSAPKALFVQQAADVNKVFLDSVLFGNFQVSYFSATTTKSFTHPLPP